MQQRPRSCNAWPQRDTARSACDRIAQRVMVRPGSGLRQPGSVRVGHSGWCVRPRNCSSRASRSYHKDQWRRLSVGPQEFVNRCCIPELELHRRGRVVVGVSRQVQENALTFEQACD